MTIDPGDNRGNSGPVRFLLNDVIVRQAEAAGKVAVPLYADNFWQMNQNEFAMMVEGVGSFYARDGREVEYSQTGEASRESLELYLNGSVFGAVLHQRQILPLHGSCFMIDRSGIMICGDTGAGKSSLTASFCLNGAEFLTDDVSPLLFKKGKPYIWALSDRLKLWRDTLSQLEQDEEGLHRVDPEMEKFYYPMEARGESSVLLDRVYILEVCDIGSVVFDELSGPAKFTALRGEIYRSEYLRGMPENEPVYFKDLVSISNSVKVFSVKRPSGIKVGELMAAVRRHITGGNV